MDGRLLTKLLKEVAAEDRAAWDRTSPAPGSAPWHPTWAQLFRHLTGTLASNEAEAVARHFAEGRCCRCPDRVRLLEAGRAGVIWVAQTVGLRDPNVGYAWEEDGLNVSALSPDRTLQSKLVETHGRLVLEVRTKEADWQWRLVGYALRGAAEDAELAGFLVLRPDENDWYAARVAWDGSEAVRCLGGQVGGMLVGLVDEERLTVTEQDLLLASVERSRADPPAWSTWQAWAKGGMARSTPYTEARHLYQTVLR